MNTHYKDDEDDYGDLEYQKGMLEDTYRTKTYYQAIKNNKDLFKNRIVADVGCGTGILSFFAVQAGAKKVYAIESTDIIETAKYLAKKNGYKNINFIKEKAEKVKLPEKVDIIISEWMGHYLFHERMFEAVLAFRDKYLKKEGRMFPEKGTINLALYSGEHWIKKDTSFWRNKDFYGVDLSSIGKNLMQDFPKDILVVDVANPKYINSNTNVMEFDFKNIELSQIQELKCPLNFNIKNKLPISSLCLWFTVEFPGSQVLDTSPGNPTTHWKHAFIYFNKPLVLEKRGIRGKLVARVDTHLSYQLEIVLKDENNSTLNHSAISSWGIKYM